MINEAYPGKAKTGCCSKGGGPRWACPELGLVDSGRRVNGESGRGSGRGTAAEGDDHWSEELKEGRGEAGNEDVSVECCCKPASWSLRYRSLLCLVSLRSWRDCPLVSPKLPVAGEVEEEEAFLERVIWEEEALLLLVVAGCWSRHVRVLPFFAIAKRFAYLLCHATQEQAPWGSNYAASYFSFTC